MQNSKSWISIALAPLTLAACGDASTDDDSNGIEPYYRAALTSSDDGYALDLVTSASLEDLTFELSVEGSGTQIALEASDITGGHMLPSGDANGDAYWATVVLPPEALARTLLDSTPNVSNATFTVSASGADGTPRFVSQHVVTLRDPAEAPILNFDYTLSPGVAVANTLEFTFSDLSAETATSLTAQLLLDDGTVVGDLTVQDTVTDEQFLVVLTETQVVACFANHACKLEHTLATLEASTVTLQTTVGFELADLDTGTVVE